MVRLARVIQTQLARASFRSSRPSPHQFMCLRRQSKQEKHAKNAELTGVNVHDRTVCQNYPLKRKYKSSRRIHRMGFPLRSNIHTPLKVHLFKTHRLRQQVTLSISSSFIMSTQTALALTEIGRPLTKIPVPGPDTFELEPNELLIKIIAAGR